MNKNSQMLWGGEPILADATLTFYDVDFENSFCALKEEAIVNEEDAKRVVKELFSKMNIEETYNVIKNAVFEIKDLNYYQFYFNPGVSHYIYGNRKIVLSMENTEIKKMDELYIELIYEE